MHIYVTIIYGKTQVQVPLGSLLGKQSIQAKDFYSKKSWTELTEKETVWFLQLRLYRAYERDDEWEDRDYAKVNMETRLV